jgi:hypothetical protein
MGEAQRVCSHVYLAVKDVVNFRVPTLFTRWKATPGFIDIERCSWTLHGQKPRAHTQAFIREKEKKCPAATSRIWNITEFLMKGRGLYIRRFWEGNALNRCK